MLGWTRTVVRYPAAVRSGARRDFSDQPGPPRGGAGVLPALSPVSFAADAGVGLT